MRGWPAASLAMPSDSRTCRIARSIRIIAVLATFLVQTRPSTSSWVGVTMLIWVPSDCHASGSVKSSSLPLALSKRARPRLIHQADPELAVGPDSRSSVPVGNPSLSIGIGYSVTLPVSGRKLAEELVAEIREPHRAVGVADDVVRLHGGARQIIFGDDDAWSRRPVGRGKSLQRIFPGRSAR